jgi:urease accessory protein
MSDRSLIRSAAFSPADTGRAQSLLQVWLSPAFPVGSFAYSHGLETAAENGWVRGRDGLASWLADIARLGGLRNDLILLAAAWRATRREPGPSLAEVAELAAALQPSAERHLEATQQGSSFLAQIEAAWPAPGPRFRDLVPDVAPVHAVAVGFAAARHAVPCGETVRAYAIAFIGNLASAAIRLGVVAQTDAQRVIARLLDELHAIASAAERSSLDELGSIAWRADIASLQHETQHTRLFRS